MIFNKTILTEDLLAFFYKVFETKKQLYALADYIEENYEKSFGGDFCIEVQPSTYNLKAIGFEIRRDDLTLFSLYVDREGYIIEFVANNVVLNIIKEYMTEEFNNA